MFLVFMHILFLSPSFPPSVSPSLPATLPCPPSLSPSLSLACLSLFILAVVSTPQSPLTFYSLSRPCAFSAHAHISSRSILPFVLPCQLLFIHRLSVQMSSCVILIQGQDPPRCARYSPSVCLQHLCGWLRYVIRPYCKSLHFCISRLSVSEGQRPCQSCLLLGLLSLVQRLAQSRHLINSCWLVGGRAI